MSLAHLAMLKAMGEEGGDCEGQAIVILQDNSERIATRTRGDSGFREVRLRPLTGAYGFELANSCG